MEITKEKNIITYFFEDEKRKFTLDLLTLEVKENNTILTNYPRLLEGCAFYYHFENNFIRKVSYLVFSNSFSQKEFILETISFLEKMDSLGFCFDDVRFIYEHLDLFRKIKINGSFKTFFEEGNTEYISNNQLIQYLFKNLFNKHNFTNDIRESLSEIYLRTNEDYLKYICKQEENQFIHFLYNWSSMAIDFFTVCQDLNYDYKKEKNIFFAYCKIKKQKEILENEKNNRILMESDKSELIFEDDEYIVIVPKSVSDFIDEANQQKNCIYTNYLEEVVDGATDIVFIRRKSQIAKSLLTCEVSPNYVLKQVLYHFNNEMTDKSKEYPFVIKYQEYLMSLPDYDGNFEKPFNYTEEEYWNWNNDDEEDNDEDN